MSNYRPRKAWTTAPPANRNKVIRRWLKGVAVHWTGPAVPKAVYNGDEQAVAQYLEAIRRYHVINRGWSDIAYNFAIDTQGRRWKLRGARYISGANGDEYVNMRYLAIVCLIGEGQVPSRKMLRALKWLNFRLRLRYPRATRITTHAAIRPTPTACPGPDLIEAVNNGSLKMRKA